MDGIRDLFSAHLDIIFFISGLSFSAMGAAVAVRSGRGGLLGLPGALWPLAGFGFLYGAAHWVEMWALVKGGSVALDGLRLACLGLGSIFIFEFGRRSLRPGADRWRAGLPTWHLAPALTVLAAVLSAASGDIWRSGPVFVAFLLGTPGAALTGFALLRRGWSRSDSDSPEGAGAYLRAAGVSFLLYGAVLAAAAAPLHSIPAVNLSVHLIMPVVALALAWSVVGAVMALDREERRRLEGALSRAESARDELERTGVEIAGELNEANALLEEEIGKRERAEAGLLGARRLESLSVLAGGLAHDFNNILTGICGNISLARLFLRRGDKAWERLDRAEAGAMRARDLTMQFLTFADGGAPSRSAAPAGELVSGAARLALSGSNVKSEVRVDDDLKTVEMDAGQLCQVVNNLVANAAQSMPEGGVVEIDVRNAVLSGGAAVPFLAHGQYVAITVRDHGVGIPRANLDRIFDPYFTTREGGGQKGMGLGLSVCQTIVARHGGAIMVESEPGEGSTFTVYLPASGEAGEGAGPSPLKTEEAGAAHARTGRLIVMDDEDVIREVTGGILSSKGYEVLLARDGAEASELYQMAREEGRPVDLVILDLTVPGGMGGKETIKRLHELDPGAKAIVTSGYATSQVMSDFRRFGFLGAVVKPYTSDELAEAVRLALTHA